MKGATPEIRVLGAQPVITALGQHQQERGVYLWDMPAPSSYAEHKKKRKHKKTGERIEAPVFVPIYKGVSAQEMRYARSQQGRQRRKFIAEQEAREAKVKKIGSAGDFLKQVLAGEDHGEEEGLD